MKLGKGTRREQVNADQESVFAGVLNSVSSSVNRDAVISASLDILELNKINSRFGQSEILNNIGELQRAIADYNASKDEKLVPTYSELAENISDVPTLSSAARDLFNSCAELANSFIENEGVADQPPKVFPLNENGKHDVKIGHRRIIAYNLAKPITGVSVIDVLIDRSKRSGNQSIQTMQRIAENAVRKSNTLAELLHAFSILKKQLDTVSEKISISQLARSTGVERTKLTRIWELLSKGVADDENLIQLIHDYQIEDVKSLAIVILHPKDEWISEINRLKALGPAQYRSVGHPIEKKIITQNDVEQSSRKNQSSEPKKKPISENGDHEGYEKSVPEKSVPNNSSNDIVSVIKNNEEISIDENAYLLKFINGINEGHLKIPNDINSWESLRNFVLSLGNN